MSTQVIVTTITWRERSFLTAALVEEQKIEELVLEPKEEQSYVGCVFRGVVDSVAKNIGGAYVDIGLSSPCFLPLGRHTHVSVSQPVLVQVTKDASGRKEPVLTTKISLSRRSVVVNRESEGLLFSKKLTGEQKSICTSWLKGEEHPYLILVRTNAARASKAEFLQEVRELEQEMDDIVERYPGAAKGALLWRPAPFYISFLRDLYVPVEQCLTNLPNVAEELRKYCGDVVLRTDPGQSLTLENRYGLRRELDRLANRQVFLKSGAFLVIEQTEAFVSIDVNSGKCLRGRVPEETYRKVNLEAAAEIARQLRLRNLSGAILVDFITLQNEDHKQELIDVMRKLIKRDHIHTEVVDLTPLGIMEILRQKVRKPLAETLHI